MAFKADELMIQVGPGKPEDTKHCPCEEPSEPHCPAHSKHPCKGDTVANEGCPDQTCLVNRTLVGTAGTADLDGLYLLRRQMKEHLSQELPA